MADNPRLTTQSSLAAQGHISLSHDDSANRPLSKPDDKANTTDDVFMVNGLLHYETASGINTSAAPVAPCLFICQRLPLCHAPLQRKSLHGPPQRQSLHVDSIHCQRLL